jgi:hypothetical protein
MPREQREQRLLAEFLAERYAHADVRQVIRLGTPALVASGVELEPGEAKLLRNFCRWADALIVEPSRVTIVEAEVLPSPGVISQLQLYKKLFLRDATYADLQDRELRLMVVWGIKDPAMIEVARESGVQVELFPRAWLAESLRARFPSLRKHTVNQRTV